MSPQRISNRTFLLAPHRSVTAITLLSFTALFSIILLFAFASSSPLLQVSAAAGDAPATSPSSSSDIDVNAVSASGASSSSYTIEGSLKVPRQGYKYVNARVLLNGGERVGLVRSDGSFQLFNIIAGRSYTLDVAMPEFTFPQVRVDVSNKAGAKGKMKASLANSKHKVAYPLVLRPTTQTQYYQKREPVNILAWFKNPMAIMMVVTLFMVVVMPRMMGNMDPAELEEMKKMQSSMSIDGLRRKLEAKASEIKAA